MDDWEILKEVLYDTDLKTAELILRLQAEDAQTLSSEYGTHGKASDKDTSVASVLYTADLKELQKDTQSRKLGEILEEQDNEEEEIFEAAAFGWKLKEWTGEIEQVQEPITPIACTTCANEFEPTDIMQAPCSHHYCRGCLEYLYNESMVDETLFPQRCCHQDFPWDLAKQYLSHRCRCKFGSKRIELETKDRTYCYIPTCSAFIKPDHINPLTNMAQCQKCKAFTCSECKGAFHIGKCPQDPAMEMLNSTAQESGWQRCSVCRRILELKYGCNHMTCICKHEFCYECGETWKRCSCAQWDEARLIENAARHVDEGIAPMLNAEIDRDAQVAQIAEHLRANHECVHGDLRTHRAAGKLLQCEICGIEYPEWIKQCKQCMMLICMRCKHNRL